MMYYIEMLSIRNTWCCIRELTDRARACSTARDLSRLHHADTRVTTYAGKRTIIACYANPHAWQVQVDSAIAFIACNGDGDEVSRLNSETEYSLKTRDGQRSSFVAADHTSALHLADAQLTISGKGPS